MKTNGKKKIVLVGAGGHAKVVATVIAASKKYQLAGATDAQPHASAAVRSGLKILGSDAALPGLLKKGVSAAAVGVGSISDTSARKILRGKLEKLGFLLPSLVHPQAIVSASAQVESAVQVMAGCVIQCGVWLSKGCVINTGAVIEHDCLIGLDAFIAPGAVIGGECEIGEGAFIGIGAVVIQGVRIGAGSIIGAGAVVLKDVPAGKTAFGVPAAVQ